MCGDELIEGKHPPGGRTRYKRIRDRKKVDALLEMMKGKYQLLKNLQNASDLNRAGLFKRFFKGREISAEELRGKLIRWDSDIQALETLYKGRSNNKDLFVKFEGYPVPTWAWDDEK